MRIMVVPFVHEDEEVEGHYELWFYCLDCGASMIPELTDSTKFKHDDSKEFSKCPLAGKIFDSPILNMDESTPK